MRRPGFLLLATLALVACGKVGPPVAPEVRVPAAVTDLTGVVEDGAVTLTWTTPARRADGTRLRDLREIRLYRVEEDGAAPPKPALLARGRVAGYQEIATIPLAGVTSGVVRGRAARYVDRNALRDGRRYTYVVVSEDERGRISPPSNRLTLRLIAPPEAPPPPTAEAGDGEVRLAWQPPARLVDGTAPGVLAYEVSRSSVPDGPADAVFQVPAGQTRYLDRSVENERTYHYAVRAIRHDDATTARSAPSRTVAATPGRTRPPTPPANLVAVAGADSVSLSWSASPDPGVALYIVYRAGPEGTPVRVGSVRAPATTFTDRQVSAGTYRYAVTAQDATARANESAPSNEVTVTLR